MSGPHGVVLDAGAFIALERRDRVVTRLFERLLRNRDPLVTSAGVVAQIWRGGSGRQAPLSLLLIRTEVVDLTKSVARTLGLMLGGAGASDPVDAHIVFLARQRSWPVLTSDPHDLLAIDPRLDVHRV